MLHTRLVRTCVDGDDHALVLRRSPDGPPGFDSVFDLLPGEGPTDALAVTCRRSSEFVREWRDRTDRRPRNVGVLGVGEPMRSAAATAPAPAERTPIRGVADPTDTDGIRDAAAEFVEAWPADGRTVVFVDSVTALSNHLDVEEVVEFVETFARGLDVRDAFGCFCLRPAAHDRATVRRVASLFDTVVERVETDGEPTAAPSVDDCFDAVADARRRHLLDAIADGDTLSVDDLTDRVAERTPADRRTVHLSLVNVHLPELAELGVVAYDRDERLVEPGRHFEQVVPYLRKATAADTPA